VKANYKIMVEHLKSEHISIDKKEVLRYLQYKSDIIDEETDRLINECIIELKDLSELKYVYRIFNISNDNASISFEDEIIIKSKDLSKLFKNSNKVALMGATLGLAVENRIRYYSLSNLSKGIIFDACATTYIEALCDYVENEIRIIANKEGTNITFRFSAGYGDVSIHHQQKIINSLNAAKLIGLNVSESSILIPRKSVTAFIGFVDNYEKTENKKSSCSTCNLYDDCSYRENGGKSCGK